MPSKMGQMRLVRFALVGLIVGSGVAGWGQQPADPSAAPIKIDVAPLQTRDPGVMTLHANARAVLMDVVVTDGHGHAVKGLTAADFQIFEDGQPQTVASLEEHRPPTAAEMASLPKMPALGVNTFTNLKAPAANTASTVLLMDALDSSPTAQMFVRGQLLSYVKSMQPGSEIAIFQLDTQLRLVQGFTSDPEVLERAIKDRGTPRLTPLPQNGGYVQQALRMDVLTQAMQNLGSYLQTRPGRKNLVWFTAHIPRTSYDDGTAVGGSLHDSQSFMFDYTKATDALVMGQVSVYPVDSRGLQTDPAYSAANARGPNVRSANSFGTRQFFQHTDLDQVADATGGKAFYNTNGIKQAVAEVVDTGSHYYTLSYYPTNKFWDGRYRKLKLSVDQPGLQLEYRRGYYAMAEAKPAPRPAAYATTSDASGRVQLTHNGGPGSRQDEEAFGAVMQLGAVDPAQIVFQTHIKVDTATQKLEKDQPLPKDNYLEQKYRDKPFRNFVVTYHLSGDQVALMQEAGGKRHGSLEFVTLLLDEKGGLVNSFTATVDMDLRPESYQRALTSGMEMPIEIAVPEKGSYFLRMGVHDRSSGRAGAIEVSTGDVRVGDPAP